MNAIFFLSLLISITYGLIGKKGNVHGEFIKKVKMQGEKKIMIKRSKRNRMNQQQQQRNRQVRRKTVSRLFLIGFLGAVPNQVSSTHACSHRERIEKKKKRSTTHSNQPTSS